MTWFICNIVHDSSFKTLFWPVIVGTHYSWCKPALDMAHFPTLFRGAGGTKLPPNGPRRLHWGWLAVWWAALCLLAPGVYASTLPAPLVLERQAQGLSVQPHIQTWVESSHTTRDRNVHENADRIPWAAPPAWPLNIQSDAGVWMKLRVQQPTPHGDWVLALPTTAVRDLAFFGPYDAQGRALTEPVRTGLVHPYTTRPLGSERVVFPLRLPEPGVYTVYLWAQSSVAHQIAPSVWDTRDFLYARQHKRLFDGLCYGILLTLLVYNLVLARVFRDASYGLYGLTCAAALLTLATYNGHTAHYLWPHSPWWIERSYVLGGSLWIAFSALFARHFLNTRETAPTTDRVILGFAGAALLATVPGVLGQVGMAQSTNEWLGLSGALYMTLTSLTVWRRGYAPALWYLAGQATLFATVMATVLVVWGWLDAPFLLANGLQIGVAAEMVVFAMALSVRIQLMRRDQVELNLRAAHLARAASTDPLTGVANRAGLKASAEQLLAQPDDHALLLIDLNKFKPVNDTFGHEAGDRVLVEVAQRIEKHLRDSDVVARIGGDEFVVLLGHVTQRATLEATINRLLDAIDEPVRFGQDKLQVSASAGVALYPQDGGSLDALLRAADKAMYEVKDGHQRYAFYGESLASQMGDSSAQA